ncbi:MAG: 8-amino-7-oxononanoate synthase [Bacteroidota bacterium]
MILFPADSSMKRALVQREIDHALRNLVVQKNLVDFCSNDYLGYARLPELRDRSSKYSLNVLGSTGSRLLSGNTAFTEELEQWIATRHQAETGLIFNSGYDANIGLFASVPQRGDTILYDEYVHASIRDGIRLSFADSFSFRHNDINHLKERLKDAVGTIYIAVESVYSMDGDVAPLKEMIDVSLPYRANLIVDEAHATGVCGPGGMGLVSELKLQEKVFARIHTFGKALGCHGAIVLGSALLRKFLINFARSFIYTTALPMHSLLCIKCAYEQLAEDRNNPVQLNSNISYFRKMIQGVSCGKLGDSLMPIQVLHVSGNQRVTAFAEQIQKAGYDVRAIKSPTVPRAKERLRICIHSFNSENQIAGLAEVIKKLS